MQVQPSQKAITMSNVNSTLVALMGSAASGLADAVKVGKRLESEIFATIVSVTAVSAYRVGRAMLQGATAEEKDKKWGNAFTEFQNHFIAAGNAPFRESDGLAEFKVIEAHIRKSNKAVKEGGDAIPTPYGMVKGYLQACREQKLTKKEHAIAEVQSVSRKLHEDAYTNHADVMRELAGMESLAAIAQKWQEFVTTNYGTSYLSIKARLSAGKASAAKSDDQKLQAAIDLIAGLTDAGELNAIIKKLQARADEMTAAPVAALIAVGAAPAANTDDGVPESDAAYTDRVAA